MIIVIGIIISSSGIRIRIRRQNGTGIGLYAGPQLIVLLIESDGYTFGRFAGDFGRLCRRFQVGRLGGLGGWLSERAG